MDVINEISKLVLLDGQEYYVKDSIHRSDKNNPHEVTAKQIGAKSIEPDYQISGAAGWYKFLVVPVESNRSRKIVLRLVESYSTVGFAIVLMYLNRNSSGEWSATSGNVISSAVINNTDIGFVLNEQDNEVEYYYHKRSNTSGNVLVNVIESVGRTGSSVDLSEQFESTPVSEFPSNGTYFNPSQDGAGNVIPDTYATKTDVDASLSELEGDKANTSVIASVEASSTASTNHAVGDHLMLDGVLYEVTAPIASGETITPGTNVSATTVTGITDGLDTRTTALETALDGLVSQLAQV